MTIRITDLPTTAILRIDAGLSHVTQFVPVKTVTSPNARVHWRRRHDRVKRERAALRRAFIGVAVPPLPVRVTFVRLSTQACDDDNLPTASKGLRDELALLYGTGDSPRHPITWAYEQAKCKRGQHGVRVHIQHGPAATRDLEKGSVAP